MKLQFKKLTTILLFISFIVTVIALMQITRFTNTNLQETNMALVEIAEDYIFYDEDIIKERYYEDINKEEIDTQEMYLSEEIEEIKEDNKTNNLYDKKEKLEVNSTTNKNTTSTVDMSPIKGENYIVKSGDTLFLIAQRANIPLKELININNLNSDVIYVGQVLRIKTSPQRENIASSHASQSVSRGNQRDDDIYWLSRIIHAEAQGEPYEGKVAVGNVILNRVKNKDFPNTIYGVIFDKQYGYTQFSPVIDGTIYNNPNKDSIQAAIDALNGARPVGNALYFLNPRKATNFWIVANRQYMKTIGEHDFYY